MSKRLENKNIIVTAAGQGIGRATAIAFYKQGAKVVAIDLNEKTLASLNNEYKDIKIQKLDLTDYKTIKLFVSTIKNIDVLFNAVGYVHHGTIMDCEEKDWDFSFNTNIKSMYFMIKSIIPKMIKQKKGNIINVASIASSLRGLPNRFAYGSSKAAMIRLSKSLAIQFASYNIRSNIILPGPVETPMQDRWKKNPQLKKQLAKLIPLQRIGKPQDIANAILFLLSEEGNYITGTEITVDGGITAKP